MSTYQRPVQPFDPVIPDAQPKPPIRYVRDNFQATGQDSHTQPPAQDSTMWQSLMNVMPITKGVLERRWGFLPFATGVPASASRLTSFQRDSDGLRTILAQGTGQVQAYTEDGISYSTVFAPTGAAVRSLTSRNYQYFFDGNSDDLIKWNGDAASGTSNWGIDAGDVTQNVFAGGTSPTTFGPRSAGSSGDTGVPTGDVTWTTPTGLGTGSTSSVHLTGSTAASKTSTSLAAQTYAFSVPSGTIAGIVVKINATVTGTYSNASIACTFNKPGSGKYGATKSNSITNSIITLGSSTDLWSGSWLPSDINGTGFGVLIQATATPQATTSQIPDRPFGPQQQPTTTYSLNATIVIHSATITVYTKAPAGGSTTSGNGVGITSVVGSGTVNLTIGRTYYLTFYNSNTGHFSDLTPASASTGAVSSGKINLVLATDNDPQVTHKYILATADGNDPSILYQLAELVNGGGGDITTYQDNIPDTTLTLNQPLLFIDQSGSEFGVTLNTPPPPGTLAVKHQGRIWMAGVPGATHSIFFSKSIDELTLPNGFIAGKYEESWPGDNYFDISDGAESVTALLSSGTNLYIGSQSHVRVLSGNDPTNFTFPEIVHPHVGVINQESLQLVFTQGSPAGAIWLTPDFRIIQSDFNTYVDIGSRIQDILNNLKPSAQALAHATFVADGEYDLYILSVPYNQSSYCDLHLIYDMRHQQWCVWQPQNGSLALLYNVTASGAPQWLFISGATGTINRYDPNSRDDNGVVFSAIATTSWLSLGEPTQRKVLNEIEFDGDPASTLSIYGAMLQSDFTNPIVLAADLTSVVGPLGTSKFFIAARAIKARYYQLRFQSIASANITFLGSYNIECFPFNDL
jgi:hypothetical protein